MVGIRPREILKKSAMGTESTLFWRLYEVNLTSFFHKVDRVPRSQAHPVSYPLRHRHLTLARDLGRHSKNGRSYF